MFEKETVLILGAGASVDAGYPLASALVKSIYDEVTQQQKSFCKQNDEPYNENEFNRLLRSFWPINIDKFLKDLDGENNKNIVDYGKKAIARVLLQSENKDVFSYAYDREPVPENWYRFLYNALTSGCAQDPSLILKNKLKIVTFNYDVSLEYYLRKTLPNASFFTKGGINYGANFVNDLIENNLIHVYGGLHENYDNYASGINLGEKVNEYYKNISVIDERKQTSAKNIEEIHKWILAAKKIVILGYSFDEVNNNLLFCAKADAMPQEGLLYNILHRKCFGKAQANLCKYLGPVNGNKNAVTARLEELCYLNYDNSTIIDNYIESCCEPCDGCNERNLKDMSLEQGKYLKPKITKSNPNNTITKGLETDFKLN
jgi:hypothetical protein